MTAQSRPGGRPDRLYVSDRDTEFYYRWANTKDTNIMGMQMDGFEPVTGEDPLLKSLNPIALSGTGQSSENPTSLATRQRGDLILMRIRKDRYEETVGEELRQARERQDISLDTLIAQQNENARTAAQAAGLKKVPSKLVFREE